MEAAADGASSLAEAEDGSPLSGDEPVFGVGDSQAMDPGDLDILSETLMNTSSLITEFKSRSKIVTNLSRSVTLHLTGAVL